MKLVTVKVTRIQWHDADTTPEERMMLPATYDRLTILVDDEDATEEVITGRVLDTLYHEFDRIVTNVKFDVISIEPVTN